MKLDDWRMTRNLSLGALAETLGVSRMTLWRYCAGQSIPRPEIMAAIQRLTEGRVGPADFYPPAAAGAAQVAPPPVAVAPASTPEIEPLPVARAGGPS